MIHTSRRVLRIREKLCLDQHQMAQMLEIKRSLLSMIEIERRSEPKALRMQLDILDELLFTKTALSNEKKAIESSILNPDKTLLQKEINLLKVKLGFATRHLAKMESYYVKYLIASMSFQTMIDHALTNGNKPLPLWKQQLNILETKIKSCDSIKQERVKARIKGMKSEIEYLEKAI